MCSVVALRPQSPRVFDERSDPGGYHHDVKAHTVLTWPSLRQIPARNATDLALFGMTNLRLAKPAIAATADLDECQGPSVVSDNVQFAYLAAKVSLKNAVTRMREQLACKRFGSNAPLSTRVLV
jgi:hypothetical protein